MPEYRCYCCKSFECADSSFECTPQQCVECGDCQHHCECPTEKQNNEN